MSEGSIEDVLAGRARWNVTFGDCLAVMPTLPDKSVDHVITDPPYSKDLYSRTRSNKGSGLRPNGQPVARGERLAGAPVSSLRLASGEIGSIDAILDPVCEQLLRLAKRWVLAFHDCEIGDRWRSAMGEAYVRTGAWVKANPMPQISGDRPAAGFEPCTIGYASDGKMRWNGGGRAAVWTHPNCQGPQRPDHPCPKPLGLMLDLVDDLTDPDDVVLDPFCGSGQTGLACLMRGRRFIGVDLSPKFATLSRDRLGGLGAFVATTQIPMFPAEERHK